MPSHGSAHIQLRVHVCSVGGKEGGGGMSTPVRTRTSAALRAVASTLSMSEDVVWMTKKARKFTTVPSSAAVTKIIGFSPTIVKPPFARILLAYVASSTQC